MFTDTHCHLNTDSFKEDFDESLARMQSEGISRVINVGFSLENSKRAIDLSDQYDYMYATVGLHPHEAKLFSEELLEDLRHLATNNSKVIAIGETGLDYFHNLSTVEEQERSLRAHCSLARDLDLPLIIHCRDAYWQCLKILDDENMKKVVWHCYACEDLSFAEEIWSREHLTSFSGIITYPKNEALRQVASQCPDDKWLLETDCPYLPPQPYRGKRNEPSYMIETAKVLAGLRELSMEQASKQEEVNILKIFAI